MRSQLPPEVLPDWWRRWYPTEIPDGGQLRRASGERWLRILTMTGGKRYGATRTQFELIFARWAIVAGEVMSTSGATCFIGEQVGLSEIGSSAIWPNVGTQALTCFASFRDPGDPVGFGPEIDVSEDVSYWSTPRGTLNPRDNRRLISAILTGKQQGMWYNDDTGEVVFMYDNCIDVVASTVARRDSLEARLSSLLGSVDFESESEASWLREWPEE